MATVKVLSSGSGWRVTRNGTTKSTHRKKNRAVSTARRLADAGDRLVIQRQDGSYQRNGVVR